MACIVPPWVSQCKPVQTYQVGGSTYFHTVVCDANGTLFHQVAEVCDGVPSGTVSYFNFQWQVAAPTMPVGQCDVSVGPAVLDDDDGPVSITGPFSIPATLRSFSLVVTQGPVTINGITVPAGFSLSREAWPDEVLPSFDLDATGGEVIFDSLRVIG